jgi:hypothetical protein
VIVRRPFDTIDQHRLAPVMQRPSLAEGLVSPMGVAMPRVVGQHPPQVLFAIDQPVVEPMVGEGLSPPWRPRSGGMKFDHDAIGSRF